MISNFKIQNFSNCQLEELIKSFYHLILLRNPSGDDINFWLDYLKLNSIPEFSLELFRSKERVDLIEKINSQKIAFLHIPKCAGTSFNSFFSYLTKKIYITHNNNNSYTNDYNLISGHFGFAFLKQIPFNHSFTILRDPIQRIVSLYRFGRSTLSRWAEDDPVRNLDFEGWLSSSDPRVKSRISNYYVRVLTDDLEEPFEKREAESLQLAIDRYSRFNAVGDQKNLRPFFKKMALELGISSPPFLPCHNDASINKIFDSSYTTEPQVSKQAQQRLKELTRLDYEVYNRFRYRENEMSITIHNPTSRPRSSDCENPIQIACHWLDGGWNMVQFDAQRFPLPAEGILPQETREVEIQVTLPPNPGRYHLMVTLVQTINGQTKWLHETGEFTPQIFDREVEE